MVKKQTGEDKLISRVMKLSEMVENQEGSVVSRTVLEKDTGTVTLFAFDAEEKLSEHTAPFDALVQVLEGALEISISGNPFLVNQGEAIIMPAHEPHALRAVGKAKMLLTMIRERGTK
jgi:quercetin dioxygenase-like cupin family protein